jgi:REP element-mobilizing transposase RayT
MVKTIGYMITWTTYGTWLQGREQGFVKDGTVRGANPALMKSNIRNLKDDAVKLNREQRTIAEKAIVEASKRFRQKILAIAVYSNHIHIVCEYVDVPINVLAGYYKNAGRVALKKCGVEGRVWTKRYDKQFCFDEKSLNKRIAYMQKHNQTE